FPDRRRLEAGISARLLSELGIDKACLRSAATKNLVHGKKHPTVRRTRSFISVSMTGFCLLLNLRRFTAHSK
ncbi:MAG: hypothetical protein V3T55_01055, partial [Anaerolineales bacterium]